MTQMHQKESEKGFRMVGVIGHTLVNTNQLDNVWVPSWGLDLEYWFNAKWGIGLHNDVEMETFVVKNAAQDEIVRVNPLVFTIDALYHFGHGFVATLGPGIEIERTESFYLLRFGMEYEKDINESFYICQMYSLTNDLMVTIRSILDWELACGCDVFSINGVKMRSPND
jgi:hypothetical protein